MALSVINDEIATLSDKLGTVLAIGPWNRSEFAFVSSKLNLACDWKLCDSCDDAAEKLARDELGPEYILIAQPLPGDVSQDEIERLRQAAPLAQILIVAGSWSEGELRTGHPPKGVLRVYWHEFANWWPTRMESDWSAVLDGPLTARASKAITQSDSAYSVAIHSPTLVSFEAIEAALAQSGCHARWVRDAGALLSEFTVGIWDGGQLDPHELTELQAFASEVQSHNGKLVILLDFPRKHHLELLQQLDCHAVLGKPYVVEELIASCTS